MLARTSTHSALWSSPTPLLWPEHHETLFQHASVRQHPITSQPLLPSFIPSFLPPSSFFRQHKPLQQDLVELKTTSVVINPEDEDSGFVRIAVLPQPEAGSKTIEVNMSAASGYVETLAFEVTYFVPSSPKKAPVKRTKKAPGVERPPVNPALMGDGSDATDAALAVTDSLLNLPRMEIESVRQNIEHVRNSPTHPRPTTPVRARGGAVAPGSLRGTTNQGMGVGDLDIEFGDDVAKKSLGFQANPELEELKNENARLKNDLRLSQNQIRETSEAEDRKTKEAKSDYVVRRSVRIALHGTDSANRLV